MKDTGSENHDRERRMPGYSDTSCILSGAWNLLYRMFSILMLSVQIRDILGESIKFDI